MSMFMTQALRVGSVLLVLGAAGAAGAGWLGHRDASGVEPRAGAAVQAAPAGEEPPVSEVKAGRFRVNVVERGVVETSRVEDVYSQIQGLTTIIFIRPDGSVVKKGERICELDSSALKDQLINQEITARAAEAAYQTAKRMRELAEIALTEFREGTYKIERETILGAIAMAREGMKKAETRLERTRRARQKMTDLLSRKGGATEPAELLAELEIDDRQDASERSIAHEKVALELAQSKLQLLDNYTKGRTVAELESAIERKKSEERAKEAAWELEKAKAEKLRRQIASCTLLAPYDGVVVLANNPNRAGGPVQIEEGATVRERQKLLSVRDRHGPMRVRTRIHDSNVSRVRPGLRAEIKVDAFVDRRLTGRVTSVGPLPDQAPGEKSYRALVELDETPSSLLPGFTADIEILVTERENVLSVPVEAVSRFEGKDHVAVRQPGGRFAWREVTLGLTNDKNVEVKQGLKAGEIVSLKPNAVMKDSGKRGG